MYKIFTALIGITCSSWIFGQSPQGQDQKYAVHGWQLLDYRENGIYGAGVSKAYRDLLKGKKSHVVVVAVIDGGIDTAHEDLVGHIWTNTKEIPGNGIDDDHNGYVDDVHGWNFLGNPDGRNISEESYEVYREYWRLRQLLSGAPDAIFTDTAENDYWMKIRKRFLEDSLRQAQTVFKVGQMIPRIEATDSILKTALHKDSIYARDLEKMEPSDSVTGVARKNGLQYFRKYWITPEMTLEKFIGEAEKYLVGAKLALNSYSDDPNALRREIVGDDFNNINDRNYGNNNISAGDHIHGTHVSGIIAAARNNGTGINGIAGQVLIMSVRAIPDGDERDKDVALAIRYAVDNGALIINMSFGKYFSPGKKWVDEAVQYAELRDVLLVHSAGNDESDNDSVPSYPNPHYGALNSRSGSFLTVGASGGGPDSLIMPRFSNYGKKDVDLFAPGVKIYSTVPGNQYETFSGTSMAAPVVSGVAALLLEYYPRLSARQLKYVLVHSVMKLPDAKVKLASSGKIVDFGSLSSAGGIVNAYNALKLAATLHGERGKTLRMKRIQTKRD
ncbi:MAG: S8 family peptidase [Puia sp.]